ncbi:hypothetical protein BGP_4415 [Beggiatoa sp. PS]|nr:hypothetical protein BGP_4415 [Beggiatoa sp. PS]
MDSNQAIFGVQSFSFGLKKENQIYDDNRQMPFARFVSWGFN